MMRILLSVIAILFPWLALLLKDNPGGALVALVLQATLIGWIPASIWAWKAVHAKEELKEDRPNTSSD